MIDWTVNVTGIVQIVVLVAGAIAFVIAVKSDLSNVKVNVVAIMEEMKELRKVVTVQASHEGRIDRLEQDTRDIRSDIKDLRHGDGFVLPLQPR